MKELESIVAELVEKRFTERLVEAVDGSRSSQYHDNGEIDRMLRERVRKVLAEELDKRDAEIRKMVNERVDERVKVAKLSISLSEY